MMQTTTERAVLAMRPACIRDDVWEQLKANVRNDGYPVNAGTYRVEFLDQGCVSAARRFDNFLDTMNRTRVNFKVIAMNEGYHRISVLFSHDGFDENVFVD